MVYVVVDGVCLFMEVPVFYSLESPCGYLHLVKTSFRYCFSVVSSPGIEKTALALCSNVLITLYLAAILQWLSQFRHWSVLVGFQYQFMEGFCFVVMLQLCSEKAWNCLPLCALYYDFDCLVYVVDMV